MVDYSDLIARQGMGASAEPTGLSSFGSSPQAASPVPASIPSAAEFNVGVYSDGSAPVVRVKYDTGPQYGSDQVWIDGGDFSSSWFAFPYQYANEVCAAIMRAAQGIEARRAETSGSVGDESAVRQDAPNPDPLTNQDGGEKL